MIFHSVAVTWIWSVFQRRVYLATQSIYGGIIVGILAKFWIAMVWYLICLWCLTAVFTLVLVKLM